MPSRGTAEGRKDEIRRAASAAFAHRGLHGVSVDTIAREVGISEAYVFRLFGSKRALFVEVVTAAFRTMAASLVKAAGASQGADALSLMGHEYLGLLTDKERLLLQMQGFAACSDPVILGAVRECFEQLWVTVEDIADVDNYSVKMFMGLGMLTNTLAALDVSSLTTPWAERASMFIPADVLVGDRR